LVPNGMQAIDHIRWLRPIRHELRIVSEIGVLERDRTAQTTCEERLALHAHEPIRKEGRSLRVGRVLVDDEVQRRNGDGSVEAGSKGQAWVLPLLRDAVI